MSAGEQEADQLEVWLVRHGETEWSRCGRHTGCSDLPLTPNGEAAARALRPLLEEACFDQVFTSPLQRACRTAVLAGITNARIDSDLVEWDYGEYEGMTRDQIRENNPGWTVWRSGAKGGESPQQVSERADRLIAKYRGLEGRLLLVAHGHILRSLAARWVDEPVALGEKLPLDTATVSVLAFDRGTPVLQRWNCRIS